MDIIVIIMDIMVLMGFPPLSTGPLQSSKRYALSLLWRIIHNPKQRTFFFPTFFFAFSFGPLQWV